MPESENDGSFYDRVARRFGGYRTEARYTKEFAGVDPEAAFKRELLSVSGRDKLALDVGCADGRFTLSVAPSFLRVVAIDVSAAMLEAARRLQQEQDVGNVSFEERDVHATTYPDASFDVIYSRRGPSDYHEFNRLLRPGGYYVSIGIGEKDCQEIKEIFGRGQDFGEWENSRIVQDRQSLEAEGFEMRLAETVYYDEYFPSYEDLNLFLQSVPIFEDFSPENDRRFLEEYCAKFQTDKGIRLPRHRILIVSKKPWLHYT